MPEKMEVIILVMQHNLTTLESLKSGKFWICEFIQFRS